MGVGGRDRQFTQPINKQQIPILLRCGANKASHRARFKNKHRLRAATTASGSERNTDITTEHSDRSDRLKTQPKQN